MRVCAIASVHIAAVYTESDYFNRHEEYCATRRKCVPITEQVVGQFEACGYWFQMWICVFARIDVSLSRESNDSLPYVNSRPTELILLVTPEGSEDVLAQLILPNFLRRIVPSPNRAAKITNVY